MLEFLFGKKKEKRIAIEGVTSPIATRGNETLLEAALREGLRFPNDCRVGGCGTCKCRLLAGKVHERTESAYVLTKEQLERGYVLACQSVPKGDVRIAVDHLDTGAADHEVVTTEGVIVHREALTHDIARLVVRLDRPMTYTAGQYARVSLPGVVDESRCYSFARACPAEGTTELAFFVRAVPGGALSPRLVAGEADGARVRVEGPFGTFALRATPRPIVAIAGGSGLAPILAILEDAARTKCERPVVLLFGARTERDLYALETIDALRRSYCAPFVFVPVLSNEPEGSAWTGERGLVTAFIERHVDAGSEAYLCGPPAMIDAAITELAHFGVREDRIHFDKFLDSSHLAKKVA